MGWGKSLELNNCNRFRVVFEHTKLNKMKLSIAAPAGHPTYYVHSQVDNGYANKGQLMGAYIGPGSNANHFKFQLYTPKGRIAFHIDRIRYNDDYFVANFSGQPVQPNDGSYLTGFDFLRFINDFSIEASIYRTNRRNWYYEAGRDVKNLDLSLKVSYHIR